ncbi:hypothetical protein FACS189421_08390 [Bacteroidia bacterium]|nr:hypothetical protein FACS189421_08390 [Bacteroidia bacterium]
MLLSLTVQAQSIEDARKLYSEGKYAEALPVFEKALKTASKSAAKKMTDAYLSMGNIYYSLYEFEKSAEAYSHYADLLVQDKKTAEAAEIAPLIERSERAARMLSRCEDIQIIDSVVVDKKNFLNTYRLSGESGHLENQNGRIVYENPLRDKRYYAGKKEGGGDRIYSEIKLQNEWTDKMELTVPSDSLANDDYPFVLPDGLTIYYASTGKGSIGGYDLFITRYNLNNDTWLAPSQMGMPFNSIANDYMMAIDEINNIGYFATDRFQTEGKVVVYTFIPNEETISLQTEEEQALISRAKIVSIKDSWKPNSNYSAYLEDVRKSIRQEQMISTRDFSFAMNDNTVYYILNDFKNDAAKQAFLKSKELKESIDHLEEELDELRLEFAQSGKSKQQSMRSNILSKEERLQTLLNQYKQFVKNTRNFELKANK